MRGFKSEHERGWVWPCYYLQKDWLSLRMGYKIEPNCQWWLIRWFVWRKFIWFVQIWTCKPMNVRRALNHLHTQFNNTLNGLYNKKTGINLFKKYFILSWTTICNICLLSSCFVCQAVLRAKSLSFWLFSVHFYLLC